MMKNYFLFFFLVSSMLFAQEEVETEMKSSTKTDKLGNEIDYNRWSIEANFGQNRAFDPFADGFSTTNDDNYIGFTDNYHFDIGVRYMFNPTFGLKIDGAYDIINENSDNVPAFESLQYRAGIQGVVNLRNLLNFQTWTNTFGLLAHAGGHFTRLDAEESPFLENGTLSEDNGGYMVGLTPQVRLTKRLVFTLDFTYIRFIRQHLNFDGSVSDKSNNLDGNMLNITGGLTFYLGKRDNHADFYFVDDSEEKEMVKNKLDELENKIAETEKAIDDKDKAIEEGLKNFITNNYYNKNQSDSNFSNSLATEGYANILFGFDNIVPEPASVDDISYLIKFMKENENQKISLVGYTDIRGSENYNQKLSTNRAKYINDILTHAGIDQSRIEYSGDGVNPDYSGKENDDYYRMLSRRVKVILK